MKEEMALAIAVLMNRMKMRETTITPMEMLAASETHVIALETIDGWKIHTRPKPKTITVEGIRKVEGRS